jgi:hypothetical protein
MESHPGIKFNVFDQEEINIFIEHLQDCENNHLVCDDKHCAIYVLYKDKIIDKFTDSSSSSSTSTSCSTMSSTSPLEDMEMDLKDNE